MVMFWWVGLEVMLVDNGLEVVEWVLVELWVLVLMDVCLLGIDGFEVMWWICEWFGGVVLMIVVLMVNVMLVD